MKFSRRQFLKSTTAAAISSVVIPDILKAKDVNTIATNSTKTITILHTNDFHSRLESFPENHKLAHQGGITNIHNLLKIHKDENALLLDCGDVFQGTPYFNIFQGKVEYEWMNLAGYKATTLGNHEFDLGIQHLADTFRKYAKFDLLNCNYNLTNTPLQDLVKPYEIYTVNQLNVGVIGVGLDLTDLVTEKNRAGITYQDPIVNVQYWADYLKHKKRCNAVVVISHLGYKYESPKIDDLKLAAATSNIDVILGGHTHTFLTEPTKTFNKLGKSVIVNQAHWAGLVLGKIQLTTA